MKKLVLITLAGVIAGSALFAQNTNIPAKVIRNCGTEILSEDYEKWIQPLIEKQQKEAALSKAAGVNTVFTIPVVFHVIHNGSAVGSSYNISDAQILSQLAVLNEDYRRLNPDTSTTPVAFQPVAADCEIQFCMAQRDPNGNTTTGIDRINRTTAGFTAPPYLDTYINGTIKPATIWNTSNYLNIWVVPDYYTGSINPNNQLLGHATFPSGSGLTGITSGTGTTTTDGVVIWYKCVGRVGTLDPSYNKGRTATHEIGHWLGLRHIWGDGTCASDFCADTPTQQTANFSCPSYPHTTCSNGVNGDQFMNYMDYCDDDCLNMFTLNQKTRMVTALNNAPMRISQRNSIACTPVGLSENPVLQNVSLFPNPANNSLHVTLGNQMQTSDVNFRILNLLGAEISASKSAFDQLGNYELNVSALSQGFYMLEINTSYGMKVVKFQVSR